MIFGVESIDSIIAGGAIDFDSPFETWSIFDETSDMGVFEGAESNGDVTFSSKSIFVVELSFFVTSYCSLFACSYLLVGVTTAQ